MPIRTYTPQDQPALLHLIGQQDAARAETLRRRWQWQLADNPYLPVQGPYILVLEEQGELVGALLSFPFPLQIHKQQVVAHCLMDFIVHPNFRGGGVGLALHMIGLPAYVLGTPNRSSLPLWRQFAGSLDLCQVETLSRVLNMRVYLHNKGWHAGLALAAGLFWRACQPLLLCRVSKDQNVQVRLLTEFDSQFDELWKSVHTEIGIGVVKDFRYLHWRYVQAPEHYLILAAYVDSRLTGFLVGRLSASLPGKAYIVDMLIQNNSRSVLDALLAEAVRQFAEQGAASIDCLLTRQDYYWRSLRQHGFIFKRWSYALVGTPYFAKQHVGSDLAAQHWRWFKGDGELDFIFDN